MRQIPETVIRHREAEVIDSLTAMGLSLEILRNTTLAGETARDACTANDPLNAPGFDAWARAVRALREQLIGLGWTRMEEEGLPLIVSPSGSLAVAVATGDDGTGKSDQTPKTKYARGPATVVIVQRNRTQTEFWESDAEEVAVPSPTRQTWFLLRRRVDDMVFSEFSLPAAVGTDGRVEEWVERIILPPILLDPTRSGIDSVPPTGGGDNGDIDVRVGRRNHS
jgi:hypothetical protein